MSGNGPFAHALRGDVRATVSRTCPPEPAFGVRPRDTSGTDGDARSSLHFATGVAAGAASTPRPLRPCPGVKARDLSGTDLRPELSLRNGLPGLRRSGR
jgi:hypothetical protein